MNQLCSDLHAVELTQPSFESFWPANLQQQEMLSSSDVQHFGNLVIYLSVAQTDKSPEKLCTQHVLKV